MTVRTEAVSSKAACKRRRVSDVARELNCITEEQNQPTLSRILENDENCMTENAPSHRVGHLDDTVAGAHSPRATDTQGQTDVVHLDYGALVHVFERCEGISRVKFGCVCKLWRKVRQALAVHNVNEPQDLKSTLEDDDVKPYDTVVLPPGMYKQRVLCSKPVKLISQASWHSSDHDQQLKATGSSITADSVIFWQERAPAILVNADAVCLHNVTVKVEAAAHEFSSVAYGPRGRAITMKQCTVLGSTGLRVPYTLDPLTVLLLKMEGCTIQGVKGGLSGVCVLSGQVVMTDSSIHDCTYGMEVQEDGHAFLERTSISFCTECAMVCEGHAMLKRCQVFANLAAWAKGPIVMEEEEGSAPSSVHVEEAAVPSGASCSSSENAGGRAGGEDAGPCHSNSNSTAGICTGLQSECVVAAATGIRSRAQIRLSDCQVDSGRLTGSIVSGDAEQNGNSRVIRRLMREVYGNPDQDYDDWQIVMLSDMEDEGSDDGDAVMDSDDQASDDMVISSDESGGEADDNDGSDHEANDDADVMANVVAGVESEEESEDSSEDGNDSGVDVEFGSDGSGEESTSSDEE